MLGANKSFVVKPDSTIEVREVKVGERLPQEVEILEGLEPGETVAVTNLARLTPGMSVKVQSGAPPKT
ncbi:MAG: hypothetical protein WHT08_18435 [Bryobacteraceae bacterium]